MGTGVDKKRHTAGQEQAALQTRELLVVSVAVCVRAIFSELECNKSANGRGHLIAMNIYGHGVWRDNELGSLLCGILS